MPVELANKQMVSLNPLITDGNPSNHIIVGIPDMYKNQNALRRILLEEFISKNVNGIQIHKLREIAKLEWETEYKGLFSNDLNPQKKCNFIKHTIETKEGNPIAQRNIQIPKHWEEEINNEIMRILEQEVIRPSTSQWCSTIVPIRKKTGELRMCVDYRMLNEVTIRDQYPLPRIDEIIDELASAKVFSTLDVCKCYYQIEIKEEDRCKTAFRSKNGFYEFNRMPFGL